LGEGPGDLIIYEGAQSANPLLHYKGGFKNDLFNEYGTLVTPEFSYNGHFENGKKCGTGKIKYADFCYEGIWFDDDM
jgi:hypothetical protein